MKIGISTKVKTKTQYLNKINDFINFGYKHIELNNKNTRLRLSDVATLIKIRNQKKISYSLHSMTQDLFCADKIIASSELATLRGEIRIASLVGCKNFIFHISKKTALNKSEIKNLITLVKIAKNSNLNLCLENNSSTGPMSGDYLMLVAQKIKNLKICLDLGHLKIAINSKQVTDPKKFVDTLKNKIIELHLSSNNKNRDSHSSLKKSEIKNINSIINTINKKDLLLVIETNNINQAEKTKAILQKII